MKYTEQYEKGKDAYTLLIKAQEQISDLQSQISESSNKAQEIIFRLENKINSLEKENKYLKRKINVK